MLLRAMQVFKCWKFIFFNPEPELKDTESAIKSKLIELLTQLIDFKFGITLVLVFKKIESKDKTNYDTFYSSSKAEIIINENDTDDLLKSIYTKIIINKQKYLGKASSWISDSVIDHTISISKYNPLAGSSYLKLPKELNHPRKGLIDIQNIDDNKCFEWCLFKYLNPEDQNSRRITKSDKDFRKRLDFKDMKFPVKIRDIHKIEKMIPSALVFLDSKIKNIKSMYQNNIVKKNILIYYW